MREGIKVLGRDSAAGARMAETLAFFEFMQKELPPLLQRWREHKLRLRRGNSTSLGAIDAEPVARLSRSGTRGRAVSS